MADSDYCTCSPIIEIPTREDLIHPDSHITPEEMLKYRTMQSFSPTLSKGSTQLEDISSSEKLPSQEYSELDKTKNRYFKCAEASLAHYNKLHSTNYKLIEATNDNSFLCGWVWYHCIFKAAPETSSVPELFFAELHGLGRNKYHVINVTRVVNVAESYDCWYCMGKNMLHPVPTLSQDPDLLYSEGRIDIGVPPEFQEDFEALKGYPIIQDNWQDISPNLHKSSHLEPFSQTSEIKELIFYKDEQMQVAQAWVEREREMDGLQSSTREAELQGQTEPYNQLGFGRQREMNHVPGTPSAFGMASYLQAGQEHQKVPNLSVPSYASQSHAGLFHSILAMVPFQQRQDHQVLESLEKTYLVNFQAQCKLQQSSSQFQEVLHLDHSSGTTEVRVQKKDVINNLNDASKHRYVMREKTTAAGLLQNEPSVHSGQFSEAAINNTINDAVSETFVPTGDMVYLSSAKPEEHGKMRNDFVSSHREVCVIDGDKRPHSPILPLVDVTPTAGHVKKIIQSIEYYVMRDSDFSSAIKGQGYNASGARSGADNVQNKENIPARSSGRKRPWKDLSSLVGVQDTI